MQQTCSKFASYLRFWKVCWNIFCFGRVDFSSHQNALNVCQDLKPANSWLQGFQLRINKIRTFHFLKYFPDTIAPMHVCKTIFIIGFIPRNQTNSRQGEAQCDGLLLKPSGAIGPSRAQGSPFKVGVLDYSGRGKLDLDIDNLILEIM